MNKLTLLLSIVIFALIACKNTTTSSNDAKPEGDGVHFGEVIDTVGMISYENLLAQMAQSDSLDVKVFGKVSGVCQTKGCWMNIISDIDTSNTEMFVEFKDYGFFMPKDLAGKEVVMKGKAFREETSVEDLRHFAEDEGLTPEEIAKITEPKTELKFLASGVAIR
ncbi:MAG: DUF4920 domain-containing protein [Saprospiraceae bacterium]|nr:DUF4920 domain-containing protein [Saprospiraceae bacterium]